MGCLNWIIVAMCVCGVGISCYGIHVERSKRLDENFEPFCDMDKTISCTSALTSEYSKGFGIVGRFLGDGHFLNLPNTYMGLIFYPIMMILAQSSLRPFLNVALVLCLVSNVVSIYLMYVMVYILHTICLVCLPTHILNLLVFLLFTVKWKTINTSHKPLKKD